MTPPADHGEEQRGKRRTRRQEIAEMQFQIECRAGANDHEDLRQVVRIRATFGAPSMLVRAKVCSLAFVEALPALARLQIHG